MDKPHGDPLASRQLAAAVIVYGCFLLLLAGWRSFEIIRLPGDIVIVADGFPSWLLEYLILAVSTLAVIGVVFLASGILLVLQRSSMKYFLAIASALGVLWILMQGVFLLGYDKAFGEGGMVWGVLNTLLLGRPYTPRGATAFGIAGYQIGQVIGLVIMLLGPGFAGFLSMAAFRNAKVELSASTSVSD